jgi:hypothetical protein
MKLINPKIKLINIVQIKYNKTDYFIWKPFADGQEKDIGGKWLTTNKNEIMK